MARKAILSLNYTFSPSTRTVVLPLAVPREKLVMITDVTTNQVIYNFSDPNLTATSYLIQTSGDGVTTNTSITLNYNTASGSFANTDKLQVIVDEYDEKFTPSETYLDPINKLRVSTPQSLIDTDYEYSVQTTKWEQLGLVNNRPYAFYNTANALIPLIDLQAVNGSRIYTGNTTNNASPAIGSAIVMLDSINAGADGVYTVDSNNNPTLSNVTGASNTFTYTGKFAYQGTTGSIYNNGTTASYQSQGFSNNTIGIVGMTNIIGGVTYANTVQVTTSVPHGLSPGNEIAVTGTTAISNTVNGSQVVQTVVNPYTFNYYNANTGIIGGPITVTNGLLYVRPNGFTVHRSYDGGVRFSTNSASHNNQYIRQTRRYFRYQSGKGIQMSTGTTLATQLNLDGISSSGTLCTVTTKDPHNINFGTTISIFGANESAYNGTFPMLNVLSPYQFTYVAATTPSATQASGAIYGSIINWNGAQNRIGVFDSQNGMFWQYDGQQLAAVRRSSTYQLSGQITVTPGSSVVTASTGFPTFFNKQLQVNDFVVIKGMSYRVTYINSDASMIIQPSYRGQQSATNSVISKTIDTIIPTSQFNIDRLDGTGPSGYNINLSKMQMFYIDYSWYGAGFVRWGVRGPDGNIVYCHKLVNNNINFLAYMRSGNLPGRYETNTFSKTTYMLGGASGIGTNFLSTDGTLYANNIYPPIGVANNNTGWPQSGTIWVKNGLSAANSEFINYTSITSANAFTGLTRGQVGGYGVSFSSVTGNNYLTSGSTTGAQVGQYVFGPGIATQSVITAIPVSGTIVLSQAALTTGTQAITFAALANVAQTFIYSATAQTSIELHSPQAAPEINHWGTSAIMDGGFTPDKSFIFTKGMLNTLNVASSNTQAIMSFRVAPTASNGQAGSGLGVREIINRMQQLPFETDLYSNGSFLITAVLNAQTSNTQEKWVNVGGSSLSQYVFHTQGTTLVANTGEPVFGFYLNTQGGTGGSYGLYSTTQQDLTQLLALGNGIIGGGSANVGTSIYPDGPDVLTIACTNIGTGANAATIQARYSWTEAQA